MERHHRRSWTAIVLALAIVTGADSPTAAGLPAVAYIDWASTTTQVAWTSCTRDLVDQQWLDYWGARLECGTMLAPLDDDKRDSDAFQVGLLRVKAGVAAQRRGSIFFNFGGPGGSPHDFLPSMAYLWSSHDANDSLDGDKRELADRFDLVAVVPRGLRGGTPFACNQPATHRAGPGDLHDPVVDVTDSQWRGFLAITSVMAAACHNGSEAYVGTLQHVRDMERARVSLGEPAMNFVGVSYGTWVGAFYAATYPEHAGRMVFDSSMNFTGTFEEQLHDQPRERQNLFVERALMPALADPAYGFDGDIATTMARFRGLPHRAREAWAADIDTPAALAAALSMGDWIHGDDPIVASQLLERIDTHRFSAKQDIDDAIRTAAMQLARKASLDMPPPVNIDVYWAVVCADTPWSKTFDDLRTLTRTMPALYPAANGGNVTAGLMCGHWSAGPRWRPSAAAMLRAAPFLIVQAEYDPATPLALAIRAFLGTRQAHMVVARGMVGHGIFGMSATPCVEHAVGHYLLSGELPEQRFTSCDVVPRTPTARTRDGSPNVDDVRETLRMRLRHQ